MSLVEASYVRGMTRLTTSAAAVATAAQATMIRKCVRMTARIDIEFHGPPRGWGPQYSREVPVVLPSGTSGVAG